MNFDEARKRAVRDAIFDVGHLYEGEPDQILEDHFEEAEHCWMFFRNRSIDVPEASLRNFAYVFGKHGGGRCVNDYWDEPTRLAEYLKTCSDYFATHNE